MWPLTKSGRGYETLDVAIDRNDALRTDVFNYSVREDPGIFTGTLSHNRDLFENIMADCDFRETFLRQYAGAHSDEVFTYRHRPQQNWWKKPAVGGLVTVVAGGVALSDKVPDVLQGPAAYGALIAGVLSLFGAALEYNK